jgi:hypothetical protein
MLPVTPLRALLSAQAWGLRSAGRSVLLWVRALVEQSARDSRRRASVVKL